MPFGKANTTPVIMSCFSFCLDVQRCLLDLLSLREYFVSRPLPLDHQGALTLSSPPHLEHQCVSGGVGADAGGAKQRWQFLTHFLNELLRGGTDPALP